MIHLRKVSIWIIWKISFLFAVSCVRIHNQQKGVNTWTKVSFCKNLNHVQLRNYLLHKLHICFLQKCTQNRNSSSHLPSDWRATNQGLRTIIEMYLKTFEIYLKKFEICLLQNSWRTLIVMYGSTLFRADDESTGVIVFLCFHEE